jgi:uncharacterized repeat protein (TIGR01451 family)
MWYDNINSSNLTQGFIFLLALSGGISACQGLSACAATQNDERPVPIENRQTEKSRTDLPSLTSGTAAAKQAGGFQLGGPEGFGNGPVIGSGVAQAVADVTERGQLFPPRAATDPNCPPQLNSHRPLAQLKENRLRVVREADVCQETSGGILPSPLASQTFPQLPSPVGLPAASGGHLRRSELIFNGGDQGRRVMVDSSFNIYNLDMEDTIGHFDTLDGERLIARSNRVAIYAPRFGAVRRVDGLIQADLRQKAGAVDERTQLQLSDITDFSTTTKQHLAVERYLGSKRASGFIDQNRGVVADNILPLKAARNYFEPYENLSLIRWGKHSSAEVARLKLVEQAAGVWQDNLGVQISVNGVQPILVNDVAKVQQIVRVDSDDRQAVMRVVKVASKMAARPGEEVEFTIRFDNLSGRRIGNVTIVDHLTSKLDYVPDSAECTLDGSFSWENDISGSLILKWDITDPIPANAGGIIRFRCRVR